MGLAGTALCHHKFAGASSGDNIDCGCVYELYMRQDQNIPLG
jgi:hypothetical protein